MTSMNSYFNFGSKDEPVEKENALKQELLQSLLNGFLILGTVLFFAQVYLSMRSGIWWVFIVASALFAFQILFTFNWKIRLDVRSLAFSLLLFFVGTLSIVNNGFNALGFVYYLLCAVILGIFHPRIWWIISVVVITAAAVIATILTQIGFLPLGESGISSGTIFFTISTISLFVFILITFVLPIHKYWTSIRSLVVQDQDMYLKQTNEIEVMQSSIDQFEMAKVQRTELNEKVKRLVDQIYELESNSTFFQKTVELIGAGFEFGYCGIFITDPKHEFAVLKAGTGEAGKVMLLRAHKLRVREEGMVGYVTARGDLRVSNDVTNDPFHKFNPLLPDSKSELVLPLKLSGETIGALDFQSVQNNAFQDHVIDALQLLADQITLVYVKNNETMVLGTRIKELESSSSQAVRDYWQTRVKGTRKNLGFKTVENQLLNWEDFSEEELNVLHTSIPRIIGSGNNESENSSLILPVQIQGQTIGVITVKYSKTDFPEDLELLTKSVGEKLATAIENAQLFEEIEEKTERESVLETISTNIRSAHDIDSILRATASELGKAMGVDEVRVHIKTSE